MTDLTQEQLTTQLQDRFKQLPKPIQNAITSADVQKQLRELADTAKLHVDQWQILENDVMLTLLGFQETEKLAEHLQHDLEVPAGLAASLAENISKIVFDPIREELERELDNPDAKARTQTVADAALQEEKSQEVAPTAAISTVAPATPPPEKPVEKAVRAPIAESYKPGEVSSERKVVTDDPYREPPV